MSLYRQPGARSRATIAAVAVALLAVGFGIGFGVGRSTAPEPSLAGQVAQLREDLRPALNALELVDVEYRQAAGGGSPTEEQAAIADVAAAQAAYDGVAADLRALRPDAAADAERALDRLEQAVKGHAPVDDVTRAAAEAHDALVAASR